MAKLEQKTVKKIIQQEISEEQHVLYLDSNELKTLYIILMSVGGSYETSPRKYSESILQELRNNKLLNKLSEDGYRNYNSLSRFFENDKKTIYFEENTLSELD